MNNAQRLFFWPPAPELAWYLALRRLTTWAETLPESAAVVRATRAAERIAALMGRPAGPCVAMARGLVQVIHVRRHAESLTRRLDGVSARRWENFVREASAVPRAVFVSAHVGPFELQMDLISRLPHDVLLLYRPYRWAPLRALVEKLRVRADNILYLEFRELRRIARELRGRSLAVLADHAPGGRGLSVFGRPILNRLPLRVALDQRLPMFVGAVFNPPGPASSNLGFDYERILPGDPGTMEQEYAAAFEHIIRNNPADWVRFD